MDSLETNLRKFQSDQKRTLLGIGPMSKNCVDATIELSEEHNLPLFLIASRRQIETKKLGHGYCNNWSTESFSEYVHNKNKNQNVILARDHGGPWQNSDDVRNNLNLTDAMNSAKKSFEQDILSNFKFIHIDPSEYVSEPPSTEQILKRIFELYEFCSTFAENNNKEVNFEVSVGKDSDPEHSFDEVNYLLSEITDFCSKNNFKKPTFFAIRIGTEVKEDRNVGNFDSISRLDSTSPEWQKISGIIKICEKNNILMKHHNTDYLSTESLKLHPKLGIHAANVAPEFGIIESKSFVDLLKKKQLSSNAKDFLSIAYSSKKWEKWLVENSTLSDYQKSIIAGHYVFSSDSFLELKERVQQKLDFSLDEYLKNSVKQGILRYLYAFNLI